VNVQQRTHRPVSVLRKHLNRKVTTCSCAHPTTKSASSMNIITPTVLAQHSESIDLPTADTLKPPLADVCMPFGPNQRCAAGTITSTYLTPQCGVKDQLVSARCIVSLQPIRTETCEPYAYDGRCPACACLGFSCPAFSANESGEHAPHMLPTRNRT
jgi:hypothetical protein